MRDVRYTIHGVASVSVVDGSPTEIAAVTRQLGPPGGDGGSEPDIVIRFVERLAGSGPLTYAGPNAAFDDDGFFLFAGKDGRARARVPLDRIGEGVEITCERNVAPVPLLIPILIVVMLKKRVLSLHASAFVFRNTGVAVLGWPGGGKTSAVVGFMAEGAEFVADDRVYVGEEGENLSGVSGPLEIRAWHVADQPEYRARLGRAERARLRAFGPVSRLEALTAARAPERRRLGRRWSRVVRSLKDELSIEVEPETLFGGTNAPSSRLDRLFVAMTHAAPEVVVGPIDRDEARGRIAYLLRHERFPLIDAYTRFRFAFPHAESSLLERVDELERDVLARVLAETPVFTVRHPHAVPTRKLVHAMLPYCV
ncbi:MAG: hypothetical protein M3327_02885 [Actinomycetota bacterium]|nr:hypothetical protein [Actinomycetota bacterium]